MMLVRRLAPAVAVLAVLLVVGLQAASAHYPPGPVKPCPGGTDAVQRKDAWFTIKAPPGMARITTHAAGQPDGAWLLVSDGQRVMRSADGGCTWKPSYDAGAVDTGGAHVLPSVAVLDFPGGGSDALLALDGVAPSRMLRSADGGATWRPGGSGLPGVGDIRDVVGPPEQLYATLAYDDNVGDNDPVGVSGALYASRDGGATWELRSRGDQLERVAVDPGDSSVVWAVRADHRVQRSADGGRTWAAVALPAAAWRDVAVARASGRPSVVALAAAPTRTADASAIAVSVDDGKTFHLLPSDGVGPVAGITFGNSPNQLLVVSGSQSTAFRGPGLRAYDLDYHVWRDVDTLQLNSLYEPRRIALSAGARGHEGYGAIELRRSWPGGGTADVIARYDPPDPPPRDITLLQPSACVDEPYTAPPPPDHQAAEFTPDALDVQLQPGVPAHVDLDSDLSAVPAPLDLYFLVDTTTSMDEPIDGVFCSIRRVQRQLGERGVDAWMGLGAYQDRYDYRYHRYADLGPPSPALAQAIQDVHTRQGKEEPMRSGLYQSATGAGLNFMDTDTDFNVGGTRQVPVVVPPGQGASFRKDALHVVVVVGNEPYDPTTPGEPSPQAVVDALQAKSIRAIGLQVVLTPEEQAVQKDTSRDPVHQELMHQQLLQFARGSGALAPAGGVDCNGDGTPDIAAGQPLVCQIPDNNVREDLSGTLVALLRSFKVQRDVELVPLRTSGLQVTVEGGHAAAADVGKPFDLASTLVIGCTAAQAGRRFGLEFGVRVGGTVIGTIRGTAACGRLAARVATIPRRPGTPHHAPAAVPHHPAPAHAPVPVPPAAPHVTPAAAVAPPPPPPAPAPVSPVPSVSAAGAPAPAPASSPAPAPGATGLAVAPHEAPAAQVATVRTDGDHAMVAVRHRHRDAVPPAAMLTLGVGGVLGFAWIGYVADPRRRRRDQLRRSLAYCLAKPPTKRGL